MQDPAWERELERRIRVYEQMEASGHWPGRLAAIDHGARAAVTALFTLGPRLRVP